VRVETLVQSSLEQLCSAHNETNKNPFTTMIKIVVQPKDKDVYEVKT